MLTHYTYSLYYQSLFPRCMVLILIGMPLRREQGIHLFLSFRLSLCLSASLHISPHLSFSPLVSLLSDFAVPHSAEVVNNSYTNLRLLSRAFASSVYVTGGLAWHGQAPRGGNEDIKTQDSHSMNQGANDGGVKVAQSNARKPLQNFANYVSVIGLLGLCSIR